MGRRGCRVVALAVGMSGVACIGRAAEHWTPDDSKCGDQPNTVAIVQCVDAREKIWDFRLNEAWKALNAMLQGDAELKTRMPALKAAELAWLKYRDANCAYYGSAQGSIREVEFAYCLRDMTQARAIELQQEGPQ